MWHPNPSKRLATMCQCQYQIYIAHNREARNVTDRQRSDSIGRTVLQTVAQKWCGGAKMLGNTELELTSDYSRLDVLML